MIEVLGRGYYETETCARVRDWSSVCRISGSHVRELVKEGFRCKDDGDGVIS